MLQITKGVQNKPKRVGIYGVESVGKTTFAAQFPKPLFLDCEGGSNQLNVDRVEVGDELDLNEAVREQKSSKEYQTIVIDSIDWAENMMIQTLLLTNKKKSIEDFGYGKGWVQASEIMKKFVNSLDELIESGKNVVLIAHAKIQRVEPPDMMAAYDRYELKLSKQSSPLVKEWCDELWFANFKTTLIENENGKVKAQGGKERVLYTTHCAAYDAKTRSGLAEELPMKFEAVADVFGGLATKKEEPKVVEWTREQRMEKVRWKMNTWIVTNNKKAADAIKEFLAPYGRAKVSECTDEELKKLNEVLNG
jgi:hypothetical protein